MPRIMKLYGYSISIVFISHILWEAGIINYINDLVSIHVTKIQSYIIFVSLSFILLFVLFDYFYQNDIGLYVNVIYLRKFRNKESEKLMQLIQKNRFILTHGQLYTLDDGIIKNNKYNLKDYIIICLISTIILTSFYAWDYFFDKITQIPRPNEPIMALWPLNPFKFVLDLISIFGYEKKMKMLIMFFVLHIFPILIYSCILFTHYLVVKLIIIVNSRIIIQSNSELSKSSDQIIRLNYFQKKANSLIIRVSNNIWKTFVIEAISKKCIIILDLRFLTEHIEWEIEKVALLADNRCVLIVESSKNVSAIKSWCQDKPHIRKIINKTIREKRFVRLKYFHDYIEQAFRYIMDEQKIKLFDKVLINSNKIRSYKDLKTYQKIYVFLKMGISIAFISSLSGSFLVQLFYSASKLDFISDLREYSAFQFFYDEIPYALCTVFFMWGLIFYKQEIELRIHPRKIEEYHTIKKRYFIRAICFCILHFSFSLARQSIVFGDSIYGLFIPGAVGAAGFSFFCYLLFIVFPIKGLVIIVFFGSLSGAIGFLLFRLFDPVNYFPVGVVFIIWQLTMILLFAFFSIFPQNRDTS